MAQEHERVMRMALEEAAKGGAEGNSAVGSVVVRGQSVVARGRNLVTSDNDPTAHAEIVALREAATASGKPEFSGCTLYTTMQPCPMCCAAIMLSGISTLVIGGRPDPSNPQWGAYTSESFVGWTKWGDRIEIASPDVLQRECIQIREEWAAKNTAKG